MASKYIKGITIEIAGDTQKLTKALEGVNKQSRDLQGELRQVERLLKLDPKNTELLEQKQKLLAKSIETTKEKLDTLKEAERQVQAQFEKGEIGEEQYRAIQREVIATEQNLQKLEQRLKETNNHWKTAAENLNKFGQKATDVGKSMTTKVTLPLLGLGAAAVKVGSDFETVMSEVQAISQASSEELAALEEKAKEMGATTKFSASEAAEALKYMAMAGWDTQQMLDGLAGVMNLAAASGEDLATVSDIVTDAMTAFGMKASESSKFADLLAKTSSSANTNVSMLGESFKYVAPVFGSLGYSAEDAALALGLMANAGIKSSQAGTTLRSAITKLIKPTGDAAALLEQLNIKITDAEGNMLPFSNVMNQLRNSFSKLTAEQQAQYAATIFGQEAMSGMLAIINASEQDYQKLAQAVSNYDGAAKKMADTMQNNLQGQFTILKSQLEGVAIQISEVLIPIVAKIVDKISEWVSWFSGLDESTQKIILAVAGLVAAIGPLLIVVGKISLGISSIITLFGGFTAVSGAAAAAAGGATAAVGGLGAVITTLTGPVGIATAAIAALTAGGIALYKHMQKDSIPTVNLFGDTVSEATQQAVGSFMELNEQATLALNQLSWSGQEVTQEMADSITNNFSQMAEQVQAGLDSHYQESLQKMQAFVNNSASLSEEEQEQILANMQQGYENRKQTIEEGEARIKEILQTASEEKRALTKEEQEEINAIQQEMVNTGIQVLSENELEAKVIMERMKQQAGEISARQAAEVVQNSLRQKEETIKAAEEQYNEVIKEIIRQRDEAGTITAEQADKLIQEAKRQRDEVVTKAEEMHNQVVEQAKLQAGEHVNQVDWETGQILSKWDMFKRNVGQKVTEIKENAIKTWQNMWNEIKNKVENAWEYMSDAFSSLWDSISNWFENLIDDAFDWGKNLIDGFIDGIKSMIGAVRDAVSSVVGAVSDFLGFSSPAKKGEGRNIVKWGYNMIEGFMDGMKKAMPQLQSTLNAMIPNMSQNYTSSTFNTSNSFVVHAVIREENDIKKVAQELYKLQQQSARGRGLAPA